jgi:hypothetical protein
MTSHGPLKMKPAEERFYHAEGLVNKKDPQDCKVVCFESAPASRGHLHTVINSGNGYLLPPLTLLEVISVAKDKFEYLPGKWIHQTLITVRPTYLVPLRCSKQTDSTSMKFGSDVNFLQYGASGGTVHCTLCPIHYTNCHGCMRL